MRKNFVCVKCGRCCMEYFNTTQCDENDIAIWIKLGRTDILKYVGEEMYMFAGEDVCPYLKRLKNGKYKCMINKIKPRACREYPYGHLCRRELEAERDKR